MTNTKNHGGKRKGAGRTKKPVGEAKIWIALGFPENDIEAYGGIDKLRTDCIKMVNERIKK